MNFAFSRKAPQNLSHSNRICVSRPRAMRSEDEVIETEASAPTEKPENTPPPKEPQTPPAISTLLFPPSPLPLARKMRLAFRLLRMRAVYENLAIHMARLFMA
jgi:hypothetical protein